MLLLGDLGSSLCSNLGCVSGAFLGAAETAGTGAGGCNDAALVIGKGDNRVVEFLFQ